MENSTEIHIAVIGDKEAGKTALCNRYSLGRYPTKYRSTRGCDTYSKDDYIGENQSVKLMLHEIGAGYLSMFHNNFKEISAVMICCDITAYAWHSGLNKMIEEAKRYLPNARLAIVVTKYDNIESISIREKQRETEKSFSLISKIAQENNAQLIKTSAQKMIMLPMRFNRLLPRH